MSNNTGEHADTATRPADTPSPVAPEPARRPSNAAENLEDIPHPWGRVDAQRTVYLRDGDSEREIGQFPDGTQQEALAYYERKFADLVSAVSLLEMRISRGLAGSNAVDMVAKLHQQLTSAAALGDLAALRARVARLSDTATELTEKHRLARETAKQQAIERCEALVGEAERIAALPETSIHWKETGHTFERLFAEWKTVQRDGPQLPKSVADALWQRFRSARNAFDAARKAHFARLDANAKEVTQRKERLIAQAEALDPQRREAVSSYQLLLNEWKQAGRAGRKLDDQLWSRFKAAGDALYQIKAAEIAQTDAEYTANLTAKQALLDAHAEQILAQTNHINARTQLTELQLKWDEIGKVPKGAVRTLETRIRALEAHVKHLEAEHWRNNNPERQARSEGLRGQLEASIASLKAEIAQMSDANTRTAAEQKLAAQQSWLNALSD